MIKQTTIQEDYTTTHDEEAGPRATGEAAIHQALGRLGMPSKRRREREADAVDLIAIELVRESEYDDEPITLSEAQAEAEKIVRTTLDERHDKGKRYLAYLEEFAPTGRSVPRDQVYEDPEVRAIRELPEYQCFEKRYLNAKRGRPGARLMQLALLFEMAYKPNCKTLRAVRALFDKNAPSLQWAYGYPGAPPTPAALRNSIKARMTQVGMPVLDDLHLAMFRRLAAQRDASGNLRHPDAGKRLMVDAQWIATDEPQRWLPEESEQRRRAARKRYMSGLRSYRSDRRRAKQTKRAAHDSKKTVRGYMQVSLVCMDTGESIRTTLVGANQYEPEVFIKMFRQLLRDWPEIPVEVVVADSLYSHPKALAHELWFKYGVHLIAPVREDMKPRDGAHEKHGVPMCKCGREKPMKLKDQNGGLWDRRKRHTKDIADGQRVEVDGHLRWICPDGICKTVNTYPHRDPQRYTLYPHVGDHRRTDQRKALLTRRNGIESLHSVFKGIGWGVHRLKFGGDREHAWLLTFAHILLIARKIVHENGDYARTETLWKHLKLNVPATRKQPGCPLTAEQLMKAEAKFRAAQPPQATTLWPDETHTGYHRESLPQAA